MKKQIFFSILISATALGTVSAQSDVVAPPVQTKPAKVEQPAGLKVADEKTAGKPGNGNEAIRKAAQNKKAKSAGTGKGTKGGTQQKAVKKVTPKDRPSEAGSNPAKSSPGNQSTAPLDKKANKGKVNSGFTPSGK